MSSSSNSPTKDWLKNQLVSHGVPLPASSAKKEEYQRLYDEQVAPNVSNQEFSSDDDADPQETAEQKATSSSSNDEELSDPEKIQAYIKGLKDHHLLDALHAVGKNPGPIVGSTREFYERMFYEIIEKEDGGFAMVSSKISDYVAKNPEAAQRWKDKCCDPKEVIVVSVIKKPATNGNSENGYSDTDEDDLLDLETASRASKQSSRSSSHKRTPVKAPATPGRAGSGTLIHRTTAETNLKLRRTATIESSESALDNNQKSAGYGEVSSPTFRTHRKTPSTGDALYFNRFASTPATTPVTTGEYRSFGEVKSGQDVHLSKAAPRNGLLLKCVKLLLLLIACVGVPAVAYYLMVVDRQITNAGSEIQEDEIDRILKTIDDQGAV